MVTIVRATKLSIIFQQDTTVIEQFVRCHFCGVLQAKGGGGGGGSYADTIRMIMLLNIDLNNCEYTIVRKKHDSNYSKKLLTMNPGR